MRCALVTGVQTCALPICYDLRGAAGPVEGEATGPSKVQAGDVTAAVKWASANRDKIAVINISIGFEKPNKALAAAIDAAIAKGIVVVAAAGNRDPDAEPEDEESEGAQGQDEPPARSEEHTSELQSLMRISYAVFCLQKKTKRTTNHTQLS